MLSLWGRSNMSKTQRILGLALLVAVLALSACSPEASRIRAGGPGADIGNREFPLPELHGDRTKNNPFFHTPLVGKAAAQ